MNEREEPFGRLELVGYERVTDHGLAVPVFGRSQRANVYYTARSSSPGGPNGQITGFDRYDPAGLTPLPLERIRETGVGEPWLDVFVWEGAAYVGTALEIWNALAEIREGIAEHAPLSLLALAEGVERGPNLQLVEKAFSWLTRQYGKQKALEWGTDSYMRGILFKGLRRELGTSASKPEMRRALREGLMVRNDGDKITAFIGRSLPAPRREDIFAFFNVARCFGLESGVTFGDPLRESATKRERVVRNRTSERAMRIAALQVAASKPHGKATTTELKNELDRYIALTAEDLIPSKTRPNEAMYQQIIGNLVSHRRSKNNIFAKGWAIYTGDGIEITDAGRRHLRTLGLQD
jgi:hypothetical protein